jgi:hypothetical protein
MDSQGAPTVPRADWYWPITVTNQFHTDRVTFMRRIPFEMPARPEEGVFSSTETTALSLNVSSGGILLLTDIELETARMLRLLVPTAANFAGTPTLAEVQWQRPVPFPSLGKLYFVGLKFVL